MTEQNLLAALRPVVEAFYELKVDYFIGGSVASSANGTPRTTLDVNLNANLKPSHIEPLVQHLDNAYYVSKEMIQDAVQRQSSFKVVHLATMFKLDVFVLKSAAYDQEAFQRAQEQKKMVEGEGLPFVIARAEDVVLHKLLWYLMGDEVSERQWRDVNRCSKGAGRSTRRRIFAPMAYYARCIPPAGPGARRSRPHPPRDVNLGHEM